MTRFDIGPWRVQADGPGWIVGKPKAGTITDKKTGEKRPTVRMEDITSHASLEQAILRLQDRWLAASGSSDLAGIRESLALFRARLADLFALTVREP